MNSGKRLEKHGSNIILQVMRDTGIVPSVVASLLVKPSRLTMTIQEAVIPQDDMILVISVRCVPNIILEKDLEPKENTWSGLEIDQNLRKFLDATREEKD